MLSRSRYTSPRILGAALVGVTLVLAACGQSSSTQAPAATAAPATQAPAATEAVASPSAKALKVALVLPGSASDKGFNQSAFESLAALESELGATTAYTENTPVADFEKAFSDYASQGFDVVIGQGFEFGDVANKVAPSYPDVKFIVTNNPDVKGANMQGIQPSSHNSAYMAGVAAAMASKTGKVGGIAGFEFPVIVAQMEAYRAGALSVNPNATVRIAYLGTFEDVQKGKEMARAMTSDGVDVVYHIADAAGLGVLQAAEEAGVYAIGWGKDQSAVAPKAVITSQIVDQKEMIVEAIRAIADGTFTGEPVFYNIDTPVTGLAPITVVDDALKASIEAKLAEVKAGILSGAITVPFITTPPS